MKTTYDHLKSRLPSLFQLDSFQIGMWTSILHIPGQLFFRICKDKFLFIVVHPPNFSDYQNQIIENTYYPGQYILNFSANEISPFANIRLGKSSKETFPIIHSILDSIRANYKLHFTSTISFEIQFSNIEGLAYENPLISDYSRIVIEAKKIKRKCFTSLIDCVLYYNLLGENSKNAIASTVIEDGREKLSYTYSFIPNWNECNNNSSIYSVLESGKVINKEIEWPISDNLFNKTIVAYFNDPFIPIALKEWINKPENTKYLHMYESSIPSWAILMPAFGLFYRAYMKDLVKYLIFVVYFISLTLGMYDMYKNLPFLRDFINSKFAFLNEIFQSNFLLRITILFSYFSQNFEIIFKFFFQSGFAYFIENIASLIYSLISLIILPIKEVIILVKSLIIFCIAFVQAPFKSLYIILSDSFILVAGLYYFIKKIVVLLFTLIYEEILIRLEILFFKAHEVIFLL